MKSLNIIALQQKQSDVTQGYTVPQGQLPELLRLIKLYRAQEEAFFDKVKRGEFAKDEKHHMMKTRKLLDNLLIQL